MTGAVVRGWVPEPGERRALDDGRSAQSQAGCANRPVTIGRRIGLQVSVEPDHSNVDPSPMTTPAGPFESSIELLSTSRSSF